MPTILAILDRPYRGAVEAQFVDCLYFAREINRQVAPLALLLRGPAVTLAVQDAGYQPCLRLGSVRLDTLPDYRGSLRELLSDGVPVTADEADLRALGLDATRLLPGVRCADTGLLASSWPDYEGVWFL
jgi:hypothetical protein